MIPTLFISNISSNVIFTVINRDKKKVKVGSYHFDHKSVSTLNKNNCSAVIIIDIPIAIGHFQIL